MDEIEALIPDIKEFDYFLDKLLPHERVTTMDFVEDVLKGNWVMEPGVFWRYIKEVGRSGIQEWKSLFVSVLVLFILAAIVALFMEIFHTDGIAKAASVFFIMCELIISLRAWKMVSVITNDTMEQLMDFLQLAIPGYMICVAATGSGMTAVIFYKLLIGLLCLIEGFLVSTLTPMVEMYMILGICESLFGEERFKNFMDIIKKLVLFILKGMIVLVSGSGMLQLLITPVIDKANINVARKTAAAIPGVGDIAESVSSITLASALTVKNSFGVVILIILILMVTAPAIRIFLTLGAIKLGAALGGISGERKMIKCATYMTDAGYLLLRLLITVSVLFFIAIAAITSATGIGA